GTWKSDRDKSMRAVYRVGVTAKQEAVLKELFGDLELTFEAKEIVTTFKGKTERTRYTIVSENGDCYRIRAAGEVSEACLRDGDLHMESSFKGADEVFVKVQ
ncbi:MAG: hypothetical protein AAGD86_05230, partial [Pseudomonadota bacterium]